MADDKIDPFALFERMGSAEEEERFEFGVDQTRLERDAQRRERLGQLRAREHPGKRPNKGVERFYK